VAYPLSPFPEVRGRNIEVLGIFFSVSLKNIPSFLFLPSQIGVGWNSATLSSRKDEIC
jgi:hypothetical protein